MLATLFAGHVEYFSVAVTSSARISNLIAGQVNSEKINEICGLSNIEQKYGYYTKLDHIPQQDTDSVIGDSIVYSMKIQMEI